MPAPSSSERPVGAEQIYAALAALVAEPVPDPQKRPESPQEADHLHLLGRLPTKTELEITAATRLTEEGGMEDVLEALLGWGEQVGTDLGHAANVLTNRLQRTALHVSEPEAEHVPPGRKAAF
ncbi:hypothetical protein [Streptomyces sp. NPDC054783]